MERVSVEWNTEARRLGKESHHHHHRHQQADVRSSSSVFAAPELSVLGVGTGGRSELCFGGSSVCPTNERTEQRATE